MEDPLPALTVAGEFAEMAEVFEEVQPALVVDVTVYVVFTIGEMDAVDPVAVKPLGVEVHV